MGAHRDDPTRKTFCVRQILLAHLLLRGDRASQKPFDSRIQKLRPHPGQAATASNVSQIDQRQWESLKAMRIAKGSKIHIHSGVFLRCMVR